MTTNYQVQYLDSDNNLVETTMVSNSSIEVEKTISEMGGDVLSVIEKNQVHSTYNLGIRLNSRKKRILFSSLKQCYLPVSLL